MIDSNTLLLFRDELEERQIKILDDCTSANPEKEAFIRVCSNILSESGLLVDEPEILLIDKDGYRVDAICWPDKDQPIVEILLFVNGKINDEEVKSEISSAFEKSTDLLRNLCRPTKRAVPEVVDKLIRRIQNLVPCPDSILVRVITDTRISIPNLEKKFKTRLRNKLPDDIHTDFRFCDIEDLCFCSEGATQGPSIEFIDETVKCFQAHEMADHDVYLAVFPGYTLAKSFREHGQRLLQKNVRAFLGLKGRKSKNKKIQETINTHPDRFLAYNNGLTITVSDIEIKNNYLIRIDDTQIVNGGQTVAVLANEFKINDPRSISSAMVAAKIIHVKHSDKQMDWIERIAETSNTQNTIKETDLSSHNPLYRKIKEISSLAVFRKGTEQYKWYFSRVRKEYEAELAQHKKNGHNELKKFEQTFPKNFVIEKGVVARADCVFSGRPWIASRGEAKCHADFLENIPEGFEPDSDWYRKLVGKIILLRHTATLARALGIGEGRSCIVEYACAIMSCDKEFYSGIERTHTCQEVPSNLEEKMKILLKNVHCFFLELSNDRSVKEHAKREETWNMICNKARMEAWVDK